MFLNATLLSLVQAFAEFLPISSSGHLIILHSLLESDILNSIAFDVILHGGSLLAVIIYFWRDVINIFRSFIKKENNLLVAIIVAIIPAGLFGFFFEDFIAKFRNNYLVASSLILGAILLIVAEKFFKKKKDLKDLGLKDGFVIGLMQVLALIPGVSRSGITIVAGMQRGFSRTQAARFSFIMAIPLILGAFIKKTADVIASPVFVDSRIFVFAFFVTFIFSLIAIKLLMKLLEQSYSLYLFAIYRILLACSIFLFF